MRHLLIPAAVLLLAGPAFAQDTAKPADPIATAPVAGGVVASDSTVVARVNGDTVTAGEVKKELDQLPPQLQQVPMQAIYPQLLEQLVIEHAVHQAGAAQKLEDDATVKARVKDAEAKIVADEYIRRQVKAQVTDAQLQKQYDDYKKAFKGETEVKASHILVKTEAEADDIIKQLKGGADFAKLAAEKSQDKAAAKRGGDLGYFKKGDMVQAFADAAFAMKPGDVSQKPVKSEFGYHVIKVVDKRESQPLPLEQIKPQLEAKADQAAAQSVVKGILAKAKIERFQMDGTPLPAQPAAAARPSKSYIVIQSGARVLPGRFLLPSVE